ncbi:MULTISPECIES: TniQ family protein [unclassified Rhizobium]|uniref:TniQ family protein n=1 Tax=unclassified Rhizobium TaxID=2613769 RepID=UPI000CDF55F9|nr:MULTISPECIES: TniQ family protein [Rhizobium]AVA23686.1 TniQ family protein [Rhizobium sp. NXC24]UWU25955.1 TniQ family protein [Rhizobium tropici]
MRATGTPALTISIRERYRDVVSDQWPAIVAPQPDELLSSWLHRLAYSNGVAPRSFASVLGLGIGMWSPALDFRLPSDVTRLLCANAGVSPNQLAAMELSHVLPKQLLLPLRNSGRRDRSTWLQFCSRCLAEDAQPYFRRRWRLATRVSCTKHGCRLRDRCPSCSSRIAVFDQSELVPQHYCVRCGYDLRRASTIAVSSAARQLDRCIDEICGLDSLNGSPSSGALIRRLLNIPSLVAIYPQATLSSLSTSARTRCIERLACDPNHWLIYDYDDMAFDQRRRLVPPADGHSALIGLLANALMRKRGRPSAGNGERPAVNVAPLLRTYGQMCRSSPSIDQRWKLSVRSESCES